MLRWTETGHDLRYTTPEMLALERGMVATAQARAGAGVGMARADTVAAAMATRRTLTADQKAMIQEICLSPAGVLVIEGDAGVGKTYALEVCREAFDASGVEVVGCALAGRAAELLEEGSDIASTTVAATLHQLQVERLPYGGVLVVDEAGMLGDRQLAELVSLAARDEAKLVVVGDPFQLQPIEAGAPMRTLSDHIGRVELHENIRQHYDWERATLQLLRDGQAREAYREYERYDRIHDAHSVAERRVQVIEDHARLEAGGLDTVILARRRDEVAALNELAHARSVAEGRVHGPALTVGDKEYQVGDRVICLANERSGAVSNGTRGVVTAVDVERQTLTLERPDKRQLTLDTTHYDAIDRGYALTVHKAQGMTADIALVVGSEGATREWAYTAMSRATLATHYYEVSKPPERDTLGVEHWKETSRSAEERTVQAWTRSELKESALDYPERYETTERITVEDDLRAWPPIDSAPWSRSSADPSWPRRRPGWRPGRRSTAWWLSVSTTRRRSGCVRRACPRMPRTTVSPARWTASTRRTPPAGRTTTSRARPSPVGSPPRSMRSWKLAAGVRARAGDVTRARAVVVVALENAASVSRTRRAWRQ